MNTAVSSSGGRAFYRQCEEAVLGQLPGVQELIQAPEELLPTLEGQYPDTAFVLNILSEPFVPNRELGAIRMEAYGDILRGKNPADIRRRYDRRLEVYLSQHIWD